MGIGFADGADKIDGPGEAFEDILDKGYVFFVGDANHHRVGIFGVRAVGIQDRSGQMQVFGDLGTDLRSILGNDLDLCVFFFRQLDLIAGLGCDVEINNAADHRYQLIAVYKVRTASHKKIEGKNDVHKVEMGVLLSDQGGDNVNAAAGAVCSQSKGVQNTADHTGCHRRQHISLPCPSLSPGVCSNLCPLSQ